MSMLEGNRKEVTRKEEKSGNKSYVLKIYGMGKKLRRGACWLLIANKIHAKG